MSENFKPLATDCDSGVNSLRFASKADLIAILESLRDSDPQLLLCVGYVGEDGNFHALSETDLPR